MSNQSLFTAAAGLKAQQQNIDTIANNIANVNTNGYRRSRQDFSEAVYTAMMDPSLADSTQTANLQLGHGVTAASTRQIFTIGSLEQTSRDLDLALAGSGFYAVENPGGPTMYTRDGTFESSYQDGRNYLVTTSGNFVLDNQGQRISSASALDNLDVDVSGRVTVNNQFVASIGVYDFANPDGLEAIGSKNFKITDVSGGAEKVDTEIRQGFTENSNVDLANEMTELISAQRAYAFLGRAITTADEMRSIENNIRR